MKEWIRSALDYDLSEDAEGYLLGRGMSEKTIRRLRVALWSPPDSPAPDPVFAERYGREGRGEYLEGRLVCLAYSPRGEIIGFEARSWEWGSEKRISDYRLPEANWNPFFLGLTQDAMQRLWDGGNTWIVEGLFDLTPVERVVPSGDVVLATVRAKLSDRHIEFLRRYVRRGTIYMAYDRDETGRKQTHGWVDDKTHKKRWGALERLERVGLKALDVAYRGGKDPGEIWDSGGEAAVRQAFAHVL